MGIYKIANLNLSYKYQEEHIFFPFRYGTQSIRRLLSLNWQRKNFAFTLLWEDKLSYGGKHLNETSKFS